MADVSVGKDMSWGTTRSLLVSNRHCRRFSCHARAGVTLLISSLQLAQPSDLDATRKSSKSRSSLKVETWNDYSQKGCTL